MGTQGYNYFPVFLVGQHYIAYRELEIGATPSPASLIIEIGSVLVRSDSLLFAPKIIGFFDPAGKWIANHKVPLKNWYLSAARDEEGPYYRLAHSSYERQEAKKICDNPSISDQEGPMESYYVANPAKTENLPTRVREARESHFQWDIEEYKDWIKTNCRPPWDCKVP